MSHTSTRRLSVVSALVLTATWLGATGPAAASPSPTPVSTAKVECVAFDESGATCEVLGVVYAITQIGSRTYIGGRFTSVSGEPRGNVAAVRADGTLDPTWNPSTDGIVYALAASSDGRKVFMGGTFTTVDGQSRSRLAAVTPDTGALISTWTATVPNNAVRALAADSGDRLYVGGNFGRIGGRAIARLGAVSQSAGAVDTGFTPSPNGTVRALALDDAGTRLYAGGGFSAIGGASRPGAAELSTSTGAATTFAPTDGGVAISMDVSPNGRLFFGTTNNRTWAYDAGASNSPVYRVRTSGDVQAILATTDEVYVGGHFSGFPEAKMSRNHIGSFSAADGKPTGWNPGVNGNWGVWAFGLTRTSVSPSEPPALSVGGDFTRVAGQARRGYARFLF